MDHYDIARISPGTTSGAASGTVPESVFPGTMASQTSLRNRVRRAPFRSQVRNIELRRNQLTGPSSPGHDDGDALPTQLSQESIA
uniref:Uncharacterized protein n=1 Tax=Bracon brevicornis TaxID=1563983 RepID=A0A6V7IJA8_9HYME